MDGMIFRRRAMASLAARSQSKYIQFEDPAVEAICVANWSSDGIGLTMEDAAAVTSVGTVFYNNTEITSFDELQYFTGLTKLYGNSSLGVFYNCSNLKSVKIPASVTEIGLRTFANCNALTDVGSLDNVEIIGNIAFVNTNALAIVLNMPKLREIQGKNNFTYSGITGIESLGSVTKIPDGTAYNNGVFAYCSDLVYVNLSDSVTYIGAHSFRGCTSLSQINIPSGVTTIGANAFEGCASLAFDELNLPNLTTIGASAFNDVKVKHIVNLGSIVSLPYQNYRNSLGVDVNILESAVIPSTMTSLQTFMFYACAKLNAISVDWNKITDIGQRAFNGCTSLVFEELNAPSLKTLGAYAFDKVVIKRVTNLGVVTSLPDGHYSNTFGSVGGELIEVILPNTLTSLPDYFVYASAIPSIDIPDSITQIKLRAFASCKSLERVICGSTTPPTLVNNAFESTPIASGTGYIYVPDESVEAYKTATNWISYADRIHPLSEIEAFIEEKIDDSYVLPTIEQ